MIVRKTLGKCNINGENYIQIYNCTCQVVTWICWKIHTRLCDEVHYNLMLKVMCRYVCILLLVYNMALPLSLFGNDAELDVYIATCQSKVFTMLVYVHFNMLEFWNVNINFDTV